MTPMVDLCVVTGAHARTHTLAHTLTHARTHARTHRGFICFPQDFRRNMASAHPPGEAA